MDSEVVIEQTEVSDRQWRVGWMMWLPAENFGPLPEDDSRDYVAEWIGGDHAD